MDDTAAGGPAARKEGLVEATTSICPVCKTVIGAEVVIRDGRVHLDKVCPDHGAFQALVYADAEAYLDSLRFTKPGATPRTTQTEVGAGCPLDCGLCPEHKQHACAGIIEVNSGCNLDCPVCFADSGSHQPDGFSLTTDQVGRALDAFVAAEAEPEVVMFSGGEPTIHPDLLTFCAMATERGVAQVVVNTNGIRLAHDRGFAAALAQAGASVYLQFDGLEEATHLALRGRDLRRAKQVALDNCAEAGVSVLLAAAVESGVNDHEVGAIVAHGISHPAVRGAVFQPVTHAGRHVSFDPRTRATNADVIHALVDQCPGWFRASDFFPVPCCAPTCRSITYLLTDGEDVVPVPRLVPIESALDYLANRALPDTSLRELLEGLWSASAVPGSEATTAALTEVLAGAGLGEGVGDLAEEALSFCASCGVDLPGALGDLAAQAFMIVIQDFQDPYTLNTKTLQKCCVHELVPDGRIIPFCAYNAVGYREQVREALSGAPVPDLVPNATELDPLLATTAHGARTRAPAAPAAPVRVTLGGRLR